jgi:hypothetical protein
MTVEVVKSGARSWLVGARKAHERIRRIDGPPGRQFAKPGYWLLMAGLAVM